MVAGARELLATGTSEYARVGLPPEVSEKLGPYRKV
jgi:hypothetical protein